ncbi:hypothetical protein BBK36DRAFT_1025017 [Trichoderma citrinoviride]|uniref:Uncharacterized protein n=1 Tax=Trichoderma citrinoviride TaxID=58853 RepID=A0A2T4AWW8_9HYPO|nr:hypothetical protein BBK36DRAFT_1025017 [Trichoderma citrinoviride]PTB61562.1 hypothetical protein BBK36DRAFT_1025017 [Trichoderma citrinoviride]
MRVSPASLLRRASASRGAGPTLAIAGTLVLIVSILWPVSSSTIAIVLMVLVQSSIASCHGRMCRRPSVRPLLGSVVSTFVCHYDYLFSSLFFPCFPLGFGVRIDFVTLEQEARLVLWLAYTKEYWHADAHARRKERKKTERRHNHGVFGTGWSRTRSGRR